jgi:hypothetical protein
MGGLAQDQLRFRLISQAHQLGLMKNYQIGACGARGIKEIFCPVGCSPTGQCGLMS